MNWSVQVLSIYDKVRAVCGSDIEGIRMKTTIRWDGDVRFVGETGTGHFISMDGPEDHGGKNVGARPMETLLVGMGGCASFDVVHILKKSRQNISSCVTEIEAERVDEVPAVFEKIHLHFIVSGEKLKEAHVKRAVELSAEKYCSASIMLSKAGVKITHSYEMKEITV